VRAQPLPLIGGFYADETRPWSMQDICNYLPVATEGEGTRTSTMAKTPPGLSPFVDTGVTDPIRGVYDAEGRLFTVAGNTAYQISNTGVAIPLGAISGVGRVRFAHNQITGGNEVLMVNGSAGWVWNTVTSQFTQITDTGYPGAIDAVFIDGYLIQIEPARRFAFHSDLADALSYNTLDRFTSEVAPDLLVALAVSNNELILFSERTTEFFYNSGAAQQPFQSKRISFNKGCAGRYTVVTMDNTVMWLGDDGVFYLLDGYSPRRISTRPIEQAIRGLNWDQAFAFVWEDSGHSVAYWTFPDGLTFGYDASQQKWHRRASYGFDRWRVTGMAYWQNRWIAGDFQAGKLWELDWGYPLEGDQEFISEITSPVVHDNQSRVLMPRLELIMDTGMPEVEARTFAAQPDAPTISGNAPGGQQGVAYTPYQYTIAGGTGGLTVSVHTGTLPAGLSLSVGGLLTGTPTTVGSSAFTVRVTDANGLWDEVTDTIDVIEAGLFVAVGLAGKVATSPDGINWTLQSAGTSNNLLECGYGNGLFVLAGSNPLTFKTSPDGITWTDRTLTPTPATFTRLPIAYGLSDWWVGVNSGTCFKSADGTSWTSTTTVTGTNTVLAACGTATTILFGDANNTVQRSTDGTTFANNTASFQTGADTQDIIWDGTQFVACAAPTSGTGAVIATSPTGVTWTTQRSQTTAIRALAFGGGVGIAVGDSNVLLKTSDWASYSVPTHPTMTFANDVEYGLGTFVVVGDNGEIFYSTDLGVTWNAATSPFGTTSIRSVAFGIPA